MNKSTFSVFVILLFLFIAPSKAQQPFTLPNNSFEDWEEHSGYSVTIGFFPIPVFDKYSTPSRWNYASFPIDENIDYSGMTITINTEIPLLKAQPELGSVPDGLKALRIETFRTADIINAATLNIAKEYINPEYFERIIPSTLSQGVVNIETYFDFLDTLMTYHDNAGTLLAVLNREGISKYMTHGIALQDFVPTTLTGSYKYTSGEKDDHGGLLLIGTRYDSNHRQTMVVGGGFYSNFGDCTDYTSFEATYQSLHQFDAAYTESTPDTLMMLFLSSVGLQPQHGSALIVDNLQLTGKVDETAVKHFADPKLILYPNPTTGTVHCKAGEQVSSLSLYDLTGRKLKEVYDDHIDLQSLPAGLYILEINHRHRHKVIKR